MTKRTLTALKQSIAHWDRLAKGKAKPSEFVGPTHCALCKLFFDSGCENCPVALRTGLQMCMGSPYDHIRGFCWSDGVERQIAAIKAHPKFRAAAAKELAFLKSLLPTKDKP